jgi:hypothetical protein
MARILLVAGGCRARRLAEAMVDDAHAVRMTTRSEDSRGVIEAAGAECWIGTPDRLATLRGALDSVTIVCWLLGTATGPAAELEALHGSRLELFVTQTIDTTARGFVYEARGTGPSARLLARGEQSVRRLTERNEIPSAFLTADPEDQDAWLSDARVAVSSLLIGA